MKSFRPGTLTAIFPLLAIIPHGVGWADVVFFTNIACMIGVGGLVLAAAQLG